VNTRAGLSAAAFHEIFASHDQCVQEAFDDSLARLSLVIERAVAQQAGWLQRVRAGLVALLGFLDDEPQRACLLVLDTPASALVGIDGQRRLHGVLARLLDTNRESGEAAGDRLGDRYELGDARLRPSLALTAELVVGGVFSVVRTTMLERDSGKLVELAPSLMAFIVTPYLGPGAARVELEGRSAVPVGMTAGGANSSHKTDLSRADAIARTAQLPIRVTRRTTLVLQAIARAPYSNNREVAHAAGIVDEGQASKLLARLEQRGVIENVGIGAARGEPNAWLLTAAGRHTVEVIGRSAVASTPRSSNARLGGAR
jgi:hypothetical protein